VSFLVKKIYFAVLNSDLISSICMYIESTWPRLTSLIEKYFPPLIYWPVLSYFYNSSLISDRNNEKVSCQKILDKMELHGYQVKKTICNPPLFVLYAYILFISIYITKQVSQVKKHNACSHQITTAYDVVNNKDVNRMLRVNNISPYFIYDCFFSQKLIYST
jgi:hypothetical protein